MTQILAVAHIKWVNAESSATGQSPARWPRKTITRRIDFSAYHRTINATDRADIQCYWKVTRRSITSTQFITLTPCTSNTSSFLGQIANIFRTEKYERTSVRVHTQTAHLHISSFQLYRFTLEETTCCSCCGCCCWDLCLYSPTNILSTLRANLSLFVLFLQCE